MSAIFQNSDGTWGYGTSTYGSLSDAQAAEQRENRKLMGMFFGGNAASSVSSGSTVGFIIKMVLFFGVCSLVATFWYIFLPIAIIILISIIRGAVKKSRAKKVSENFDKIELLYKDKNYDSIFPLLKENADKYKDAESMYCLAMAYKNGEGTEPSEEKFWEYIGKGAKYGNSMSEYIFGSSLLFDESSTEKQKKIGFKYLKKASNDSSSSSIQSYKYNLAIAYLEGVGTKKNEKKARLILEGLANAGNADAKEKLATIK